MSQQEMVDRLNEFLESERAGVQAALGLGAVLALDHALAPTHDPASFASFYDVVEVPFREPL